MITNQHAPAGGGESIAPRAAGATLTTLPSDGPSRPTLSIIVPVYNEADAIGPLLADLDRALAGLEMAVEIIFVNDGSRDQTLPTLLTRQQDDPRIRIVDLARNFGKEQALTAGLDHARGQAVIPIDADLQDPPELIPAFVEKWRQGYDVVYGVRRSRQADSALKRRTASWFYRVFNMVTSVSIPHDTGDFRLMDRKVVEALKRLPERNRFMKGLFAWVGFRQTGVEYDRDSRTAGSSTWNYWKLWNFALDGITGFSTLPLRLWSYVGGALALLSMLYASLLVIRTLVFGADVPGYTSTIVAVLFLGSLQLIGLGVIGEYLGRLYIEAKGRPLYLLNRVYEPDAERDARHGR